MKLEKRVCDCCGGIIGGEIENGHVRCLYCGTFYKVHFSEDFLTPPRLIVTHVGAAVGQCQVAFPMEIAKHYGEEFMAEQAKKELARKLTEWIIENDLIEIDTCFAPAEYAKMFRGRVRVIRPGDLW